MRRVVYLIEQPLDERNYQRFGIQAWIDRKWATEVWDLTPWVFPRVWENFAARGLRLVRFAGYFPIDSGRALRRRLRNARGVEYLIDLTGNNFRSMRSKWGLQRRGASRVICAAGSIPIPAREAGGVLSRLAMLVAKRGALGSIKWLSEAFITRAIAPRIPVDLAIVSGESSLPPAQRCRSVIAAHNFDYDIYLRLTQSTRGSQERYAVFIDQDYCFHPDFVQQGNPPVVTPARYFPAVHSGLAAIAHRLGISVRIAAHPRATYRHGAREYFGEFALEYGKTAELVRDCEVVVCHDSTAIQFAVLFNKPVIFVTTDELRAAYEGRSIEQVAAELGKSPLNLDREDLPAIDWRGELRIDTRRYADYRRKYIKMSGSPEMPLWDIAIDHIESADSCASMVTHAR